MKILLVDDEKEFCHQVKTYLQERHHQVFTESDGNLALERFTATRPDVVVLDVDLGLRGIDGRAICAQIAQSDQYRAGKLGIVMISGHYIAPSDEVLGFEVGADNYLVKPFELTQLSARIDALARRLRVEPDTGSISLGELLVDVNAREVSIAGEAVELSRLEFNVLAYLLAQPGQVRTKTDLLENVWKTQHVEEGAIAKCVSLIRRKLSPGQPEKFIKTVYGVGYRMAEPAASGDATGNTAHV